MRSVPLEGAPKKVMASVIKLSRISKISTIHRGSLSIVISRQVAARRHQDFFPGPPPASPTERALAALKYGLKPEDYETFQSDGKEWGDYPKVHQRGMVERDGFYAWDFMRLRRDYGDPINIHHDGAYSWLYMTPTRDNNGSPNTWPYISWSWLWLCFAIWMLYEGYKKLVENKVSSSLSLKQFPHMGEVHYTFNKPGEEQSSHH